MAQSRSRSNSGLPYIQPKQGRAWIPYEAELPEFYDPTRTSRPFVHYYRSIFLDAVARLVPEVLQSLRTVVWERLGPNTDREELVTQWIEGHLKKRFNLTDPWIRRHVEQALDLWSTVVTKDGIELRHGGFQQPELGPHFAANRWFQDIGWPSINRGWGWSQELPEDLTAYEFPLPTLRWSVCGEPWSEFEQRATAAFHQSLNDYRRRLTELAPSYGLEKSPRKRSRDGRNPLVAFDFLAMWQVCGWTAERVAAEFDNGLKRSAPTAEAIMDQIRWAADAIELTLRKPTGGGRRRN